MAEPAGRRAVVAEHNVSRETSQKLDILVDELGRWQKIKNLVGPNTLSEVWTRHIADSLQLLAIELQALRWADLGSGAGFPGLVLAIALAERAGAHVHLVESNQRSAADLRIRVAQERKRVVTVGNLSQRVNQCMFERAIGDTRCQ